MSIDLSNWVPAITTSGLLGGIVWLFKSLITNSLESKFNVKIEALKSDLRDKESKIESLRDGAMSGLISRQGLLYARKLEAIDDVWEAINNLKKYKFISGFMATLDYEKLAKEAESNQKLRNVFEIMTPDFDIKDLNQPRAELSQPYLTYLSWAYYRAYNTIIISNAFDLEVIKKSPAFVEQVKRTDHLTDLLKTTLPQRVEYIDKYGRSGYHDLLDEIEELLLKSLKDTLKGLGSDQENTEQAAKILEQVNKVSEALME